MMTYFGKSPEMRIFLDTNVLASAFATRGLCEDIFREVIIFHEFVSSKTVLVELERVLKEKFKVPGEVCKEVLDFLGSNIVLAENACKLKLPLSNESDILIVSEALAANADVLITGDKEIITLRLVAGMRVFSPREFWEFLQLKTEEIP
jgi:putative PIN family toxin of toxin-antitoxin system